MGLQWGYKVGHILKQVRFIKTWRSFQKEIHGVLFVTQADKELDEWQDALSFLKPAQMMVFVNKQNGKAKFRISTK